MLKQRGCEVRFAGTPTGVEARLVREAGITVHAIYDGDEEVASLASRIYGRTSCERIVDPVSGEVIVDINDLINEKQAEQLEKIGIERLKIRSVLTCELKKGCCAKCYGLNLATGQEVKIGEAVGIIAAQSIGEPGTQWITLVRIRPVLPLFIN